MEVREGSSEAVDSGAKQDEDLSTRGRRGGKETGVAGAVTEDGTPFRAGGAGWHGVSWVRLSVEEPPRGIPPVMGRMDLSWLPCAG